MVLRAMIVDDEPLARQRLRRLLSEVDGVQVVGESAGASAARDLLPDLKPSILFLDVSMPEEDGFALLESIPVDIRPYTVFITAYADAAVRAFDAQASDFMVKPIRPERLHEALDRARMALARRQDEAREESTRAGSFTPGNAVPAIEYLASTVGRRTRYLRVAEAEWFKAEGNYIRVRIGNETHLVRMSMAKLEASLDARRFVRIHRSAIVRLDAIRELIASGNGQYFVLLHSGEKLEVMRTYRHRLPR